MGGYSSASQTVSELSAIGAPTRALWVPLGIVYSLLMIAFGCGVWASARRNRPLRIVGGVMVAYGVVSLAWPFAPMHLRGAGFTLTDAMHIVLAMVTVLLMLLAMGFGAAAFEKRFRLYSVVTMVILVAFGALTDWIVRASPPISPRRGLASGNASTSEPTCSGSQSWPARSCDQDPGDASGRVTRAMAPPPSRGFSATVPPCRESRRRTMARPRPGAARLRRVKRLEQPFRDPYRRTLSRDRRCRSGTRPPTRHSDLDRLARSD